MTLPKGVIDAWLFFEIVRKLALVALGTVVLVVELAADLFGGVWLDDLSFDGVRKKAVEAILAIAGVEVDAGIVDSFHMGLMVLAKLTFLTSGAFVDCEVLI